MLLVTWAALLALAPGAEPSALPGPTEPAPAEATAGTGAVPAASPPAPDAPARLFAPVSFRASFGAGASREALGDGLTGSLAGALLFRAGPVLLGVEGGWRTFFPGGDVSAVEGFTFSALAGTGWALGQRSRLVLLVEGGWQAYQPRSGFLDDVSGGGASLPFAGVRLGVEWRGASAVLGLGATARTTLGTAREPYTDSVCVLGCTTVTKVASFGGATFGLELSGWVDLSTGP